MIVDVDMVRHRFNFKRRIKHCTIEDVPYLSELFSRVSYGGNPQHKRNPGDFGLNPPRDPRPGKSLCDTIRVFKRTEALELLKKGIRHGLISEQINESGFPQCIWSVLQIERGDLIPLESQIENPYTGVYHGYPLPQTDPMYEEVLKRWSESTCLI